MLGRNVAVAAGLVLAAAAKAEAQIELIRQTIFGMD
ncbi:MAG: hypothetical protein KatS3mg081_2504 [Gemmatimonadales bacterium]|nr:hypothetical protein HRbin33_01541 [bacterium HR33]GIW53149.1 MAG: hypothetical protein KatS3mg081_2504 [Gemmatimonadales bacterium]